MTFRLIQVDAFSDQPFSGNPAAVCLMTEPQPDQWMQAVAGEMNLSETAFVWSVENGYSLRWFTPKVEVDLCGHATVASAHAMWTEGIVLAGDQIQFQTKSGTLTAEQRGDWIELDFPSTPATQCQPSKELIDVLGIEPCFFGKTKFDSLVVVDSEQIVTSLQPNFDRLAKIPTRGVIVTSRSHQSFRFVAV